MVIVVQRKLLLPSNQYSTFSTFSAPVCLSTRYIQSWHCCFQNFWTRPMKSCQHIHWHVCLDWPFFVVEGRWCVSLNLNLYNLKIPGRQATDLEACILIKLHWQTVHSSLSCWKKQVCESKRLEPLWNGLKDEEFYYFGSNESSKQIGFLSFSRRMTLISFLQAV